ncbi:50S ribosomal protein L9 [Alphaproteobacteria bacterium SO-S41]|nr:50S ribosomal protein L9 [Alphaproteobacteria bacterium SO-S41]
MQIVLLERVEKLGQMGDVVNVKPGFARNFLLPRGKALRATKLNIAQFETQRAQLEARNLERRSESAAVAAKLDGQTFVVLRQAGETGILYGSVNTRDIANAITEGGFSVARNQIILDTPIKSVGMHPVKVQLHPEVRSKVTLNVARNADEAERQARGEDVTVAQDEEEAPDAAEMLETAEVETEE